jgi:hypothetical protein
MPALFVISHRRSGTHWTLDALRHNSPDVAEDFVSLWWLLPGHSKSVAFDEFRSRVEGDRLVLVKTHTLPAPDHLAVFPEVHRWLKDLLQTSRKVYVYRNGMDVMVSLYHFVRSRDATARDMTFSEFLRSLNKFDLPPGQEPWESRPAHWARHVREWLARDDVVPVRYEDMHASFAETVRDTCARLGLAVNPTLRRIALPSPAARPAALSPVARLIRWLRPARQLSSACMPRAGKTNSHRAMMSDADREWFMAEAGQTLSRHGD